MEGRENKSTEEKVSWGKQREDSNNKTKYDLFHETWSNLIFKTTETYL